MAISNPSPGKLKIFNHNPFFNKTKIFTGKSGKFKKIFQDKLKDLNGKELQAVIRDQPGRISCSNGTLSGVSAFFFNTFVQKLNSGLKIKSCTSSLEPFFSLNIFTDILNEGNYDLILSTNYLRTFRVTEPICSYQSLDFCVAIPRKFLRKSLKHSFIQPFKLEVETLLLMSIFSGSLIWAFIFYRKLSKSPNSPARFFFGVFGYIVGQDVGFQRLCLLQNSLLQLFAIGALFLTNFLNSNFLSLREYNEEFREIAEIEDIKKHDNLSLVTPPIACGYLNASYDSDFMKHFVRMPMPFFDTPGNEADLGVVLRCRYLKTLFNENSFYQNISRGYYILDEKLNFNFEYYYYDRLNPYRNKLQQFTSFFFEGALERYYYLINERQEDKSEPEKLVGNNFDDIDMVFLIYLAGNIFAIFAFIGELLWGCLMAKKRRNRVTNLQV